VNRDRRSSVKTEEDVGIKGFVRKITGKF